MLRLINFRQQNGGFDKNKLVILIAWAVVNTFFLIKNGIVNTGEAEKYIGQAKLFLESGNLSAPNLWFYFIEISLITFCLKLHMSFAIVIIVHFFFNLLATFYFFKTLLFIFNSNAIAIAGTLVLLFNQPYQEFNTFLQTESLFYSFTLMLSCYIIHLRKLSFKNLSLILFFLLIISITRPTGLLFMLPVFLYLFFICFQKLSAVKKAGIFGAVCILFLFILNKALASGGEFDFMLPFRDEDIICGLPSAMNGTPVKIASNGNSISGIFYYITHNFSQFASLAWLKTVAFFGLYRSYYSKWHNAYLIIYFYSIYILTIASIAYWIKKEIHKFIYFLSVILMTWLTVMLTCDDWHNRFYLSISPYLIILSMGFVRKFAKDNQQKKAV